MIEEDFENKFSLFYKKYYVRFVRYAYYYVNNKQLAEDMTHDALLYYWEHKDRLNPNVDPIGYIITTIRHKCLNYLKHLQIEVTHIKKHLDLHEWEVKARIMTLEDENYDNIISKDIINIVTKTLSTLPKLTQDIFIANSFHYQSRKDIAAKLNVSSQSIDYHLKKANAHLAKYLKHCLHIISLFI